MSLLGIDVGTTGVKAVAYSEKGQLLAQAYEEYDIVRTSPGWAELDAAGVWQKTRQTIRRVASIAKSDPIRAISVSSLGEAMVPVTYDRQILGPSIVPSFDRRGEAYLQHLADTLPEERLYALNGNSLGNNYSLTRLKWLQTRQPDLYQRTDQFLLWGSFVLFMLGAQPAVDFSLANRTLLFDVDKETWSDELLAWAELDRTKLPATVPSGAVIGSISQDMAAELGISARAVLVSGAHDQCANAVGCGVVEAGLAVYGMGTFFCITPAFRQRRKPEIMLARGLNTEHHAVPGLFASFIYNQGGILVKWFRDTFAAAEYRHARQSGANIYDTLFTEIPPGPSPIMVLPHFSPTGPPEFITDSRGVMVGLQLDTTRGDILKGIIEGASFYLKEIVDSLPPTGIKIQEYRATGGGARSDRWVQTVADIMGRPVIRPENTEAGALGAAIIAGVGSGAFASYQEGVEAMVRLDRTFEPDLSMHQRYARRFQKYQQLWPLMQDYLQNLPIDN
ncbi:MAG: hypothetical protein JW953_16595 [Anaerolineae bacterium]|nr:hypothetical protein [Anaerolineae bacterium]